MSEICWDFVLIHKTDKKQLIGQNQTLVFVNTRYKSDTRHILIIISAF